MLDQYFLSIRITLEIWNITNILKYSRANSEDNVQLIKIYSTFYKWNI